jgi:hypothetical protein
MHSTPFRFPRAAALALALSASIGIAAFFGGCGAFSALSDSNDAADSQGEDSGRDDTSIDSASDASSITSDCSTEDASFGAPNNLACTGLYSLSASNKSLAARTISPEVSPYDPALHSWNDGADTQRFFYMPSGSVIDTSDMNEWTFPVGFKAWQEIKVAGRRIETRMFWKRGDRDWVRTTYRWSEDESTATSMTMGDMRVNGSSYSVPTVAQCDACHAGRVDRILGFEAVSLSQEGANPSIDDLYARGLITDPPSTALVIPSDAYDIENDRGAKALAWLHTNCGTSCHNSSRNAVAKITGLDLRLDVGDAGLGPIEATNAYETSVGKKSEFQDGAPVGGGCPGGGFCRIVPGDPAHSLVLFRASHRGDSELQMPPFGTNLDDTEGLALLRDWIESGSFR